MVAKDYGGLLQKVTESTVKYTIGKGKDLMSGGPKIHGCLRSLDGCYLKTLSNNSLKL